MWKNPLTGCEYDDTELAVTRPSVSFRSRPLPFAGLTVPLASDGSLDPRLAREVDMTESMSLRRGRWPQVEDVQSNDSPRCELI